MSPVHKITMADWNPQNSFFTTITPFLYVCIRIKSPPRLFSNKKGYRYPIHIVITPFLIIFHWKKKRKKNIITDYKFVSNRNNQINPPAMARRPAQSHIRKLPVGKKSRGRQWNDPIKDGQRKKIAGIQYRVWPLLFLFACRFLGGSPTFEVTRIIMTAYACYYYERHFVIRCVRSPSAHQSWRT